MKLASPLLRAAILQLISFIIVGISIVFLQNKFSILTPLWVFVFVQGVLASLLSTIFRLEWWWWVMNLFLPAIGALFIASQIPAYLYLSIFFILFFLYFPVLVSRVPYFPSKPSLLPLLLELLPKDKAIRFVDIGSGFGGVLFQLETVRPDCEFIGIEFAPFPWLISWCKAQLKKSSIKFKFCKYETVNFHDFDIVFAYLSPAVMPEVWEKVRAEMRPGTLFLSYEFPVPAVTPDLTINLEANEPILYGWRI